MKNLLGGFQAGYNYQFANRLVLGVEDVASPSSARTDRSLEARAHAVCVQHRADAIEMGPPMRRRAGQIETGHDPAAPAKMRDSWLMWIRWYLSESTDGWVRQ